MSSLSWTRLKSDLLSPQEPRASKGLSQRFQGASLWGISWMYILHQSNSSTSESISFKDAPCGSIPQCLSWSSGKWHASACPSRGESSVNLTGQAMTGATSQQIWFTTWSLGLNAAERWLCETRFKGTKPYKTSIGNKYLAIRSEHAHTHTYIYMVIEEVMFEMRSWQELAVLKGCVQELFGNAGYIFHHVPSAFLEGWCSVRSTCFVFWVAHLALRACSASWAFGESHANLFLKSMRTPINYCALNTSATGWLKPNRNFHYWY